MALQVLELFCGIGGFSAAVTGKDVRIVGALDHDQGALDIYRANFPAHGARKSDLERATAAELAAYGADFWWLSPPCQPYSVRGTRRDLDDPRAASLARLLAVLAELPGGSLPAMLALENVPGFARSQARARLVALLASRGYEVRERLLCPTELGVPSRRPRYYLAASRTGLKPPAPPSARPLRPLAGYLDPSSSSAPAELLLPPAILGRFRDGLRILDAGDPAAYTTCFTAGYGKSIMHAGSYLRCGDGVRRFAPEEIARLLHFPEGFRFPAGMALRRKWHLVGNSLSVVAVREVLRAFPGLEMPAGLFA